ncbi:MAG: aminoglycoside phosphotransferase family protein [Planctomycetes bacterium]|nr:aminoglycoside phosphotransferase family protein [Planctomycetota bacterium]
MSNQFKQAMEEIRCLVESNPGLSIDSDYMPPHPGATNDVVFGHFNQEPVVFKRYGDIERKHHEKKALGLFHETGYVPGVLPFESGNILVMQRLTGKPFFLMEKELDQDQWRGLFRQLGAAVARIVECAPGDSLAANARNDMAPKIFFDYQYYREASLESYFDGVCELSAKALSLRQAPHKEMLAKSLQEIREHRNAILSWPGFVCMDDFHYNNIIADGPKLQGFIDLEMTRYGNEVLALAAFLSSIPQEQMDRWTWFREGYEDGRRSALDPGLVRLAAIAAPFTQWIRFMWYWSTDELPRWAIERNVRTNCVEAIRGIVEVMKSIKLE